jgi:hypothetical protein
MIGPWSVPVLANMYRTTPSARTCSKNASAPVDTGIVVALFSAMDISFLKLARPSKSLGRLAQLCQERDVFSRSTLNREEPSAAKPQPKVGLARAKLALSDVEGTQRPPRLKKLQIRNSKFETILNDQKSERSKQNRFGCRTWNFCL